MKLEEAKMEFVQTWGSIGSSWGIPRSMAQIHALLLANKEPLSTEDVMENHQNLPWKCQYQLKRADQLEPGS